MQKISVWKCIILLDVTGVRAWMVEHPSIELGEMNIRRLRERAQSLGVPNYSRKDKSELIISIQFRESSNATIKSGISEVHQRNYGVNARDEEFGRNETKPATDS